MWRFVRKSGVGMTLLGTRRLSAALVLALVAVGILMYFVTVDGSAEAGGPPDARVAVVDPAYAFDAKDERKLVGASENVFLGRVVEKSGTELIEGTQEPPGMPEAPGLPDTQFSVEVLRAVKGDLAGNVTVSQHGGYDPATGQEAVVEDDHPLRPGQVYMFSTNHDPQRDWQQIVAGPFGNVGAESQAERDALTRQFAEARNNQILDP